jgi:uncharacterized YigZ family protein
MSYKTIAQNGRGFFKDKGSKFLGFAIKVRNESEVKSFLDQLRKEHPGACHVCYAFKLGTEGKIFRASDDGEPNNSAGQPILGQINSFGVTQVLVAVVRYFGGTKLGVRGLIQAYRAAAKEALENAGTTLEEPMLNAEVLCNYEQIPSLMKEIKMRQSIMKEQMLDLTCKIKISFPEEQYQKWVVFFESNKMVFKIMNV